MARSLVLYWGDPGSIPSGATGIFSYALLCYGYHVVRWELTSEIGPLFCLKWFSVIKYDDFFEEGECYGPGTLTYIST